jgi:hypothetical protein
MILTIKPIKSFFKYINIYSLSVEQVKHIEQYLVFKYEN